MYKDTTLLLALLLWCAARVQGTPVRRQLTGYAPVAAACPATPLVRPANGVGSAEAAFIASRYTVASQSLAAWLATVANDATCNSASSARKRDWTDWGDWDKGDQSSSSNIPDPISASTSASTPSSPTSESTTGSDPGPIWSTSASPSTNAPTTSSTSTSTTSTTSSTSQSSGSPSPATTSSLTSTSSTSPSTSTGATTTANTSSATTTLTTTLTTSSSTFSTSTTSSASTSTSTTTSTTTALSTTSQASTLTSTTTSVTSSATTSAISSSTTSTSTSTSCTPESFQPTAYPLVGLTTSGGGYRSLLTGAGVIQGFDARDSQTGVSGLYQGLTYEAGLSGGGWLLTSIAGNDWPTISELRDTLWEEAFQTSLLVPGNLLAAGPAYAAITADLAAKEAAGFPPTLVDAYGRLLSYQLLEGDDGGVMITTSDFADMSNFTTFNAPYPIITALGVQADQGECTPGPAATQYEIHPYEFGSWDDGVAAFAQTEYIGSSLSGGNPTISGLCIKNYDNAGYVAGTTSNLFNTACAPVPPTNTTDSSLAGALSAIVNQVHEVTSRDNFAVYPNPFYDYAQSSMVASQEDLYLVDGGEALQNNPIWPFLHRPLVDVLIVNDNSADTSANYPNGSEIYTTYQRATDEGLARMPVIPDVATFLANGFDTRPTFFGCNDPNVITIVYIPNQQYTYPSGQSTFKLQYTVAETDAMIANGQQIASKGGDPEWPLCLACGIMRKAGGTLPSGCASCYDQYCYN
ncbi:Lysophospholipase 1 [Exophiala xenobiotica]|uniref:Lysophospholipase n=1 Tax=Vermiconidia calcicola TaxID=1690605 RepID=A0AAV9PXQ9_9PEZI|nr:Lysophospholipase 1 [Exophiala xenobiotica]KAK5530413.1 Lysophospholipase 1 [Vermiconidia calcicola]KAK5531576.1 Lysophospholipase 1 [Chaetothyriales sp. CCFEE 6169]KAK5365745.1 Lysophospholipase 1 [Exophiala xenobiotica]KAK5392269.1 Lysophospholipase 1 [Exophiala xenobiotica]